MESRVKASHLRDIPNALAKALDKVDLPRKVLGAIRADPAKRLHQSVVDQRRRAVSRAAVHHTVPHCLNCREQTRLLEPVNQRARGTAMVAGIDCMTLRV